MCSACKFPSGLIKYLSIYLAGNASSNVVGFEIELPELACRLPYSLIGFTYSVEVVVMATE